MRIRSALFFSFTATFLSIFIQLEQEAAAQAPEVIYVARVYSQVLNMSSGGQTLIDYELRTSWSESDSGSDEGTTWSATYSGGGSDTALNFEGTAQASGTSGSISSYNGIVAGAGGHLCEGGPHRRVFRSLSGKHVFDVQLKR